MPPEKEDAFYSQFEDEAARMWEEELPKVFAANGMTLEQADELLRELGIDKPAREILTPPDIGARTIAAAKAIIPKLLEHARPTLGRDIQERFGARWGILSLSDTPTNLLMWAHYADSHRGFAVELDGLSEFFHRGSPPSVVGHPIAVTYARDRPALTMYTPEPTREFFDDAIRGALLTKSVDWSYEREYRVIFPLDDPDTYPHEVVSGRFHLFPIPPDAITGVVIGARASEDVHVAIRTALSANSHLSHVTVRKAEISLDKYAVDIKDESLSAAS
jgi:hypothetical protein